VKIQRLDPAFVIVVWALLFTAGPTLADDSALVMLAAASTGVPHESNVDVVASDSDRSAGRHGESNTPSPEGSSGAAAPAILWSPRTDRGVPALREGGATRGSGRGLVVITLVPQIDEAALTMTDQPVLHWYLSGDTADPVAFTLIDPDAVDPIVEITVDGPHRAGVHGFDLAEHGVVLKDGRRYEWYVAVVPDQDERSADTVARAAIERVAEPELAVRVGQARNGAEAIQLLAAAGMWYDALDRAQRDVAASPTDAKARARFAGLLEQVEIELPAD
jgi:hypothetical protein